MRLPSFRSSFASRTALCVIFASAAVTALALAAEAQAPMPAPGSGQQIYQDQEGDESPATASTVLDAIRLGGASDGTTLHLYLAVPSYSAGMPHRPTGYLPDYQTGGTNPGYFLKFQVGTGLCYATLPRNYVNTNNWVAPMQVGVTDCSPTGTASTQLVNVSNLATWECNEIHFRIPFSAIGGVPPAGTVFRIHDVSTRGTPYLPAPGSPVTSSEYDTKPMPPPGMLWEYTLGMQGPNPNITNLTVAYSATPTPHVDIDWDAPQGGNMVTGYRIERRMLAPAATAWVQLPSFGPIPAAGAFPAFGAMTSPPTTYDDSPAPTPGGTYEYRVTPLRCTNPMAPGNPAVVQVELPTPPVLTPYFTATGPGILSDTSNLVTACLDSHIDFQDFSWTPYPPIVSWSWNFGDNTAASPVQNPTHIYTTPGLKTVVLTVRDASNLVRTFSRSILSLGDPNCCPTLQPLPDMMVAEGNEVRFTLVGADAEGNAISYILAGLGGPLPMHDFDTATGAFSWRTTRGQAGLYPMRASVYQAAIAVPASDACRTDVEFLVTVNPLAGSTDSDMDGVPDPVDRCPSVADHGQQDADRDGMGDACDKTPCGSSGNTASACGFDSMPPSPYTAPGRGDGDRDGILEESDNCPAAPNNGQADLDGDGPGDVCDLDIDGDGVMNAFDNCPVDANSEQADRNGDGLGDACNPVIPIGASRDLSSAGMGSAVARPSNAQMPRMGLAAIAFVAVAGVALVLAMRMKK